MSHEYPVPPWEWEEAGGVKVVMVRDWDTAAIVVRTLWPLFPGVAARPATMKTRSFAGGNYGFENPISDEKDKRRGKKGTGVRLRVEQRA